MRTNSTLVYLSVAISILVSFPYKLYSQCTSSSTLNASITCSPVTGNLQSVAAAAPAPTCGSGSAYSVWYTFTATSPKATITIDGFGSSLTSAYTPYLEVISGSCPGTLTSIACQQASSGSATLNLTTLTVGTTYFVRVYTTSLGSSNPAKNWNFNICLVMSPNDEPATAVTLTSNNTCSNTAGTLLQSTMSGGLTAGCESAGNHWDVWYKFTALNTTSTVSISGQGGNFTNPEIQLYSGSPGALASIQCGTTSLTTSSLTIGATYYVRVSNVSASAPSGNVGFNICVTHPIPNDECSKPISLISNTTCSNTSASLVGATASTGIPVGCAGTGTYYDAWFSFVAASTTQTVSISGKGSGINSSAVQVFSGSCGALISVACGTNGATVSGLSVGSLYYVRVSNVGTPVNSSGDFNICVTHPAPVIPSIDYSKSYINVTKGTTGGTVKPGDTLEMRATLVIKSGTVDSLSFTDTLFNSKGLRLIPGSIALRTNEGKIIAGNSFTDVFDGDQGWITTNGLDTIVRLNFGAGASSSKRGALSSTSKPSVFGGTCIIMATYRVVVYAPYNTKINFKTGALTFRNTATAVMNTMTFAPNNLIVYESPGLCPNAVSATNSVGAENNGTFGTALAQNRSASPYTSYVYSTFSAGGGPQDYFYGIANNTSSKYTAINTWPKPDAGGYRVFSQWDITGDHTGATDPAKGNPACDETKPISATNPCGYMLVVNSAYKADTAFTYTVTNLCPNTYYELSAWFKNICYKCGCDSTGAGSGSATYIPTALGDSSGVRPNIAFDVNGIDYYTTGDIRYTGVTPTGSDSTNQWVKRGFVYLTGPTETSFILTLRNNAPGGGGNDWALDDISVATCLPNMQYSPSLNPTACMNNVVVINDTIRSYFNNYNNYQWQRSVDNGATWTNLSGATGTASPAWNGSEWEYVTSYTVPPGATTLANGGDKYRVVASTTTSNLGTSSCQVTDGVSIISLNVIDCGTPLTTDLLSFNGKLAANHGYLTWTTSKESEPFTFFVEKSTDGSRFLQLAKLSSYNLRTAGTNQYAFVDSSVETISRYRIRMTNEQGQSKYSRVIALGSTTDVFSVNPLQNPFENNLTFDIFVDQPSTIQAVLLNNSGVPLRKEIFTVNSGNNTANISNLDALTPGVYMLQITFKGKTITRKLIKR
jgi:hypothetical protein